MKATLRGGKIKAGLGWLVWDWQVGWLGLAGWLVGLTGLGLLGKTRSPEVGLGWLGWSKTKKT